VIDDGARGRLRAIALGSRGAFLPSPRACYTWGMKTSLLVAMLLAASACSRTATVSPTTLPAPAVAGEGGDALIASARDDGRAAPAGGDVLATSAGDVRIVPVYHGTLRLEIDGTTVWIDPWSQGDLSGPEADYVLVTDVHPDHFDPAALESVRKDDTVVVAPAAVAEKVPGAVALANGESRAFGNLSVRAIPMYNLKRGPEEGKLYHDKGRGNGYLITIGDKVVYVSGDTECTEEMKALEDVDVAFVSMNLPYTMPPSEAAVCVRAFRPKVLYPYHYRGSDLAELQADLADVPEVEIRLRDWY